MGRPAAPGARGARPGTLTPTQQQAFADALRRLFAVPVPDGLAERANGPEVMRDKVQLWDGEVCRLIDWEEYGASDLTYEIADVLDLLS